MKGLGDGGFGFRMSGIGLGCGCFLVLGLKGSKFWGARSQASESSRGRRFFRDTWSLGVPSGYLDLTALPRLYHPLLAPAFPPPSRSVVQKPDPSRFYPPLPRGLTSLPGPLYHPPLPPGLAPPAPLQAANLQQTSSPLAPALGLQGLGCRVARLQTGRNKGNVHDMGRV